MNKDEKIYIYFSMDPFADMVFECLISFEELEHRKYGMNASSTMSTWGSFFEFYTRDRERHFSELHSFKIKLSEDIMEFDINVVGQYMFPELFI